VIELGAQGLGEALHALVRITHGAAILGKSDVLRRLTEGDLRQVALVRLRPRTLSAATMSVTQ